MISFGQSQEIGTNISPANQIIYVKLKLRLLSAKSTFANKRDFQTQMDQHYTSA